MEKPIDCAYCKFCRHIPCPDGQKEYCYAVNDFIDPIINMDLFCPLEAVDIPSGGLISKDALLKQFSVDNVAEDVRRHNMTDAQIVAAAVRVIDTVRRIIDKEPIIIKTEE